MIKDLKNRELKSIGHEFFHVDVTSSTIEKMLRAEDLRSRDVSFLTSLTNRFEDHHPAMMAAMTSKILTDTLIDSGLLPILFQRPERRGGDIACWLLNRQGTDLLIVQQDAKTSLFMNPVDPQVSPFESHGALARTLRNALVNWVMETNRCQPVTSYTKWMGSPLAKAIGCETPSV